MGLRVCVFARLSCACGCCSYVLMWANCSCAVANSKTLDADAVAGGGVVLLVVVVDVVHQRLLAGATIRVTDVRQAEEPDRGRMIVTRMEYDEAVAR